MHDRATATPRYAIYFSPADITPLARLGNEWLGKNGCSPITSTPELPAQISEAEWFKVTETARRYSFHATLKPPFKLAEGTTLEDLRQALRGFAAGTAGLVAPHLTLGTLGHFLALILSEESAAFSDLAANCVRDFDRFRAPASESEMNRRMRDSLTEKEREHLLRWGYPYVLDTWKFHMTLTCSLTTEALAIFGQHLRQRFAQVCSEPLRIDSICLYEEPGEKMPFRLLERFALSL